MTSNKNVKYAGKTCCCSELAKKDFMVFYLSFQLWFFSQKVSLDSSSNIAQISQFLSLFGKKDALSWSEKTRANVHFGSSNTSNQKCHWFFIHRVLLVFWTEKLRDILEAINLSFFCRMKNGMPAKSERQLDTRIISLMHNVHREILKSTINACEMDNLL